MLTLAATPIGNLGDASLRLRENLAAADIIAAEDTRKTRQLLELIGVKTTARLLALHDHNEHAKAAELAELARNKQVVLVSDAGMPTVADPGYRVVTHAITAGVEITVVPGPSAVVTALALSGLSTDRFAFEGFLPRKTNELKKTLAGLKEDPRTLVFFESPRRIAVSLSELAQIFGGDRQVAVCREMTKLHEEVLRGGAQEIAAELNERELKGEVVLVVAGAKPIKVTPATALEMVQERVATGERLKDATRAVAAVTGISSRHLYDLASALKRETL